MTRFRIFVIVAIGALLVIAGCANGIQFAKDTMSDPGQLLFNGHTKPDVDCYSCHNGDGVGTRRGPPMGDRMQKLPDAAVLAVIDKGAEWMPPFGDKTTEDERKQIVAWLRATFGGPADAKAQEVEAEPVETEPVEEKPAEETPAEEKPAEEKPAE